MAKRVALNFYHDWREPLSMLTDKEFRTFVLAMLDYSIDGTEPPKFKGYSEIAAMFVFPQIKRAIAAQTNGAKGGRGNKAAVASVPKEEEKEAEAPVENRAEEKAGKKPVWDSEKEAMFLEFWEAYPRKSSKTIAREYFKRLNVDRATLDLMLKALEKQKQWDQWKRDGGRFIPYPSSWLEGGQWENEEPVVAEKRNSENSSFDTDDFFKAALARSYGDMAYLVLGDDYKSPEESSENKT